MSNITDGGILTTLAFQQIPVLGPFILVVGIISFAYSTVLGWAYYGERCVEYFAGKAGLIPYRVVYIIVAAVAGSFTESGMDSCGYSECAYGNSQPGGGTSFIQCNCKRNKKYINDLDKKDDTPVEVIDR